MKIALDPLSHADLSIPDISRVASGPGVGVLIRGQGVLIRGQGVLIRGQGVLIRGQGAVGAVTSLNLPRSALCPAEFP